MLLTFQYNNVILNGMSGNMTLIALRINEQINKRLDEISGKIERSKSFIIRKAIENYLEDLEDIQDAFSVLNDPTNKWIDYAEAKRKLNLS